MGKSRGSAFISPPPPYPCYFECGRELQDKFKPEAFAGWEWFTGYGAQPLHFCPACRRTRQFEINEIRAHMDVRPDNYPEARATPPKITDKEKT